ncbi:MAG: cyanophycinase-like exopeptidase, partial [Bacteroidia bacterium]
MGGASEHDEAMKWFLQQANGGDILVLRASGSDGYNDYLYSDLGVTVNSVETIVFNNSNASNSAYVQDKVAKAEAIWMAGGNQWNYVSYWRNTPIDSLINIGLTERNIVIGGTSAGMAVQGGLYFSAENGTVTSAAALANPYNIDMTVDSTDFLHNDYLQDVITDTHYDDPDRKGRHVAFLARAVVDYGVSAKGIACDEYTAVCIDQAGLATVYGEYPEYDETIYFLQVNCEVADNVPETCVSGSSLTWNHAGQAVKVYVVKGTEFGANTFSLA